MKYSMLVCLLGFLAYSSPAKTDAIETSPTVDFNDLLKIYQSQLSSFDRNEEATNNLRLRRLGIENERDKNDDDVLTMLNRGDEDTYESARVGNAHASIVRRLKFTYGLRQLSSISSKLPYCSSRQVTCRPTNLFRTFEGLCNNLARPQWGSAKYPYQSLLEPKYDDEISAPRQLNLPDPRAVALKFLPHIPSTSKWSNFMLFYSQFVIYDMTKLALSADRNGIPRYCPCDSQDPECYIVKILSRSDPNYGHQQCYAFPRAMGAAPTDCSIPYRQQLNQVTSFLDLDLIYSSKTTRADELRTMSGGKLKTKPFRELAYPPYSEVGNCARRSRVCFQTGDNRFENNIHLTALGIMFINEHNRVAAELQRFNPRCSDEVLFQNARKITIAQYQHMTMSELVPILIGSTKALQYSLVPFHYGYSFGYDDKINPSTYIECAGAAFRFAHTQIKEENSIGNQRFSLVKSASIAHFVFNSNYFFPPANASNRNPIRSLMAGALGEESYDSTVPQMNNYCQNDMYEGVFRKGYAPNDVKRHSLAVFDIGRGREMGFRSYNDYREKCGLSRANRFAEFTNIEASLLGQLEELYGGDPNLVDLYVGGNAETPIEGAVVGETFACLIAEQFKAIKSGDRYWYENAFEHDIVHFSPVEITEIRKATLSLLLCNHSGLDFVQKSPLWKQDIKANPFRSCDKIPQIDFSKFDLKC